MPQNKVEEMLLKAEAGGYAVAACNIYNMEGAIATVKAAEEANSPAIIEFFPWTIEYAGPEFVDFCAGIAKRAKVPIGVHLDHCLDPDFCERAMDMPFDSIMIDMSHYSLEENLAKTRRLVQLAKSKGIYTEAETGRINGGEDGVAAPSDMEELLTTPEFALKFARESEAQMIAPAFGNLHGSYGQLGPEAYVKFERLAEIRSALDKVDVRVCMHGTNEFPDEMLRKCIEIGRISKINVNGLIMDNYYKYNKESAAHDEITKLMTNQRDAYVKSMKHMFKVLGSEGKA